MPRVRGDGPRGPRASLIRLRASAHPEGATHGHPAPGSTVCVGRAPLRDCPPGAAWDRRAGVAPLPAGERLGEGPAALSMPWLFFRYAFRGAAAVANGPRLRREAQPYMGTASIAGARSTRAAGGCPRKGGGERESNPPSDAWRHPPGLKPGRPTRDVSPPEGRPRRVAHGMSFSVLTSHGGRGWRPHAPRPPNIAVSGRSRCVSLTRRV